MYELKHEELMLIDGGNNLGNSLLFVGGVIIAVSTGGTAGVVAGILVSGAGLISGWE
jgi:hypothetical protein